MTRSRILVGVAAVIAATAVLVTAAPAPAMAATAPPDWPTFLQNPARTGATIDSAFAAGSSSLLKLAWKFTAGGSIATSTSIVGTTAYVGAWDGYEYALNTTNGAVIWKQNLGLTTTPACFPTTLGITSSAAVVNNVVYVGGGDANWYALNATTGAVLWKVFTGDNSQAVGHYNWSSPLIVNGFAYIGVASNCDTPLVQGQLLKVDLTSHQIVATHNFVPDGQVGGGVWTSPAYDAGTNTVFVSTGTLNNYTQTESQAIVALDGASLASKAVWQLPFSAAVTDSDWGTTPTLFTDANGRQLLAAANKNGILYAFDRNNLSAGPVWQVRIGIGGNCPACGDGMISSGVFANGVLYYAGGNNVVNGHGDGGSIRAINPTTGAVLWTRQTDGPILGSPAIASGWLAEAEGSTLEILNAGSGSLLYSYKLPQLVYGAVSEARGHFYVGSIDGSLNAITLGAPPPVPPTDANCPSGYTCQDVNNPPAGGEQTTNGVLTVTGGGTGLQGTADQFRFVSTTITGDSQFSAKLVAQSTQNQLPQAGLIERQRYGTTGTDVGAPFYAVLASPLDPNGAAHSGVMVSYRDQYGAAPVKVVTWYPANKPMWLMVQRRGNQFSAGISSDGAHYQLIPGSGANIDLPASVLRGLAAASGASTNTGTASFSNITASRPGATVLAPPAPGHVCPTPWTCQDVGNPTPVGDTTGTSSTMTLAGTGTGIGGAADSVHFIDRTVSGNQTVSARVVTPTTASNAQQGLMMRASTAPTAPMYAAYLTPGGSLTIAWRTYDNVDSRVTIPVTTVTSAAFLKIERFQDTRFSPATTFFSTFTSADGVNWTPVLGSSTAIDMGSSYLAGLAATNGGAAATIPATFQNVTLAAPTTAPPGLCPDEFTCADIGAMQTPSNTVFLNGTWTIQAAGTDIWDVFDNFHFDYQPFPADPANSANGDGTISARVVSQGGAGGPWMKSGVMIRSGTDPQAPYYGVFVTPSNGVVVQWRPTQAAPTTQDAVAGTAPLYVLISRYTDTVHNNVLYSAFTSTDGKNFSYVPGSTVPLSLPGPLVAGIATDSYSLANQSLTTFDNVVQLPGSQPPPFICPAAWNCTDVGGALPPGQDQLSNGTWNESGGGGDIWSNFDSFHLVSQNLAGDGSVSVHVTSQLATNEWAKAGPMLRANTDPGSPYYAAFVTPAHGVSVQWRTAQGGTTNQMLLPGGVPRYLRVGRFTNANGSYFTAYTSADGVTWIAVPASTVPITMPPTLLAGFGITSHAQGLGSAVTLDSVAITPGSVPPPGICPSGWACQDVGGATPAGGQDLNGMTWTIQGGGGDIWDVVDQFHLVSKPLAADGSISARVASQASTSVWAKAGLMMRATTDTASSYFAVFVTAGNGVVVQWRTAQGATTQQVATSGAAPVYLQITRVGTAFTASTSANGITWTPATTAISVPSLSGTLLDGFAVTSHDSGSLSTVAFDHVSTTP